jgi:hypothetical protein
MGGSMSDDQPEETTALTNIERLRRHLKDGTLAAKLVDTYQASAPEERAVALKTIAEARLSEIRAAHTKEKSSDVPD